MRKEKESEFVENVKVTLVCIGRFQHFDLARELVKRDMLERIITGYPDGS